MDTFDKREDAFERAFSREEELKFRARARRDRRLGGWAAEKLGLSGPALTAYAAKLSESQFTRPDDETLVAELVQALASAGVSEHRIRRRLAEFGLQAMAELQAGR